MDSTDCKIGFINALFFTLFLIFLLFVFALYLSKISFGVYSIVCNILVAVAFSILCVSYLICITIIIVKDDESVRLKKLEALKNAMTDFSTTDAGKRRLEESVERKEEGNRCVVEKRQRSVYCELMKTYMQSVTEI